MDVLWRPCPPQLLGSLVEQSVLVGGGTSKVPETLVAFRSPWLLLNVCVFVHRRPVVCPSLVALGCLLLARPVSASALTQTLR